jgi:hypothetical protein
MSNLRRSAAYAAVTLALLAPSVAASGQAGALDGERPGSAAAPDRTAQLELTMDARSTVSAGGTHARDDAPPATTFVGIDGVTYESSPQLVDGANGTVYFGEELDSSCGWGSRVTGYLKNLAKLGRVIEKSGRKVVFTVGPNKSSVNKYDLPDSLPHGTCDSVGIAEQNHALDSFRDDTYLPLRRDLASANRAGRQVYWHIDTHWNSVGGTEFAKSLADRLDPRVGELQKYRTGQQTILVDLNFIGALNGVYETGPARRPITNVRVDPVRKSAVFDPDVVSSRLEWRTSPAKRTVQGRTLLLGDSFTYRALGSLMPLFRHGEFIWVGNVSTEQTLESIRHADTVVLEVVQRYLPVSVLANKIFRKQVAAALQ